MVKAQCQRSDRISALPEDTIEKILTHMSIRDALRTSILSKKWRYCWTRIPKLVFDDKIVKKSQNNEEINKYKLVNAIFHVLLLHKGPILEFSISINSYAKMVDEIDQIILHLSSSNNIKKFIFKIWSNDFFKQHFSDSERYKLPSSFFSFHGIEHLDLTCCVIELPFTFSGFIMLKSLNLHHVNITTQTLWKLLTNCPQLETVILVLKISKSYMEHFVAGSMLRLSTSLVRLRVLFLDVCFPEQDELSFALSVISISPNLEKIKLELCWNHELCECGGPTFKKLLDIKRDYTGLNLDYLKELEIRRFHNYDPEMAFVKLIISKSPVLKKARIELSADVSVDEEVKMLQHLLLLPRASPTANVIIERPKKILRLKSSLT